jgi:allantoin racemase
VITPIISRGFRDDSMLRAVLPGDCRLSQIWLEYGPASIESAVDEVLAGPGILDAAISAEAGGAQALIIDCMLDPALDATRELVAIPVVACAEAGFAAAAQHGRFTIVTVLQRQERDFRTLAARYDKIGQLASVRGIGISVLALEQNREAAIDATLRECRRAGADDGADAVIFGCTGMLGFAGPVADALGWDPARVIDPLAHAIQVATAAARDGNGSDKSRWPAPETKTVRGFTHWPALDRRMSG